MSIFCVCICVCIQNFPAIGREGIASFNPVGHLKARVTFGNFPPPRTALLHFSPISNISYFLIWQHNAINHIDREPSEISALTASRQPLVWPASKRSDKLENRTTRTMQNDGRARRKWRLFPSGPDSRHRSSCRWPRNLRRKYSVSSVCETTF